MKIKRKTIVIWSIAILFLPATAFVIRYVLPPIVRWYDLSTETIVKTVVNENELVGDNYLIVSQTSTTDYGWGSRPHVKIDNEYALVKLTGNVPPAPYIIKSFEPYSLQLYVVYYDDLRVFNDSHLGLSVEYHVTNWDFIHLGRGQIFKIRDRALPDVLTTGDLTKESKEEYLAQMKRGT